MFVVGREWYWRDARWYWTGEGWYWVGGCVWGSGRDAAAWSPGRSAMVVGAARLGLPHAFLGDYFHKIKNSF